MITETRRALGFVRRDVPKSLALSGTAGLLALLIGCGGDQFDGSYMEFRIEDGPLREERYRQPLTESYGDYKVNADRFSLRIARLEPGTYTKNAEVRVKVGASGNRTTYKATASETLCGGAASLTLEIEAKRYDLIWGDFQGEFCRTTGDESTDLASVEGSFAAAFELDRP